MTPADAERLAEIRHDLTEVIANTSVVHWNDEDIEFLLRLFTEREGLLKRAAEIVREAMLDGDRLAAQWLRDYEQLVTKKE